MTLREATPDERSSWDDLVWGNPGGPELYQLDSYAQAKAPVWRARHLVHELEGRPPVYALYLYQNAFQFFRMGYASALAWLLFLVNMIITAIQFVVSRRLVHYEGEAK